MDLRYPVGQFNMEEGINQEKILEWINEIENAPQLIRAAVKDLQEEQLNTPYRPGGWTIRQVVHHVADSHMNSYIRLKLALTEDTPTIKPYQEDKWAELSDSQLPVEVSLTLLEAIHSRWVHLLRSLSSEDLKKSFNHPESGRLMIEETIGLYAWHGRHHTAHITQLLQKMNW